MITQTKQPDQFIINTTYWRCGWLAAHNPMQFEFQRADYPVIDVRQAAPGDPFIIVKVNGLLPIAGGGSASAIDPGAQMYLNTTLYKGSYYIRQYTHAAPYTIIQLYATWTTDDLMGGYLNDSYNRENYYLQLSIQHFDWSTNSSKLLETRKLVPDSKGLIKADVSTPVRNKVTCESDQLYNSFTHFDKKSTCIFRIDYLEKWKESAEVAVLGQVDYFAINAARQNLTKHGSNLQEYMPIALSGDPAKWITGFAQPYYFPGFPYDIGFLYSEHIKGIAFTLEQAELSLNKTGIGNKSDQVLLSNTPCETRLKLRSIGGYSAGTKYLDIKLRANSIVQERYVESGYIDAGYYQAIPPSPPSLPAFDMTVTQRIELMLECVENPVYLRWKATGGGWDYFLLNVTQKDDPTFKDGEDYENTNSNLETNSGNREMLNKYSTPVLVAGACGLDRINLPGFKNLFESVKVQMLMNPDTWVTDGPKWQTVFVSGKIPTETKYAKFDIELTITQQERNLISQ